MKTIRECKKGFTLIELLAVLIILSALTAIVVPIFKNKGKESRYLAHRENVVILKERANAYLLNNDKEIIGDITDKLYEDRYIKEIPVCPIDNMKVQYKVIVDENKKIYVIPDDIIEGGEPEEEKEKVVKSFTIDTDYEEIEKTYGGSLDEKIEYAHITSEGGAIFVGSSKSTNFGITQIGSETAKVVMKVDGNGQVLWKRVFERGLGTKLLYYLELDDGYIFCGQKDNSTTCGAIIFKVSKDGNLLWKKIYDGNRNDCICKVIKLKDNNLLALGKTDSYSGDFPKSDIGYYKFFIMKMDQYGNKIWIKEYGGNKNNYVNDIIEDNDNNIVVVSQSYSTDQGHLPYIDDGNSNSYAYVYKFDSNGDRTWIKRIGSKGETYCKQLFLKDDNQYVVNVYSHGNEKTNEFAGVPSTVTSVLFILDKDGNIVKRKYYGTNDYVMYMSKISDGKYLLWGSINFENEDGSTTWCNVTEIDKDLNVIKKLYYSLSRVSYDWYKYLNKIGENHYAVLGEMNNSDKKYDFIYKDFKTKTIME